MAIYDKEKEKFVCEICEKYEDANEHSVTAHEIHCKKKAAAQEAQEKQDEKLIREEDEEPKVLWSNSLMAEQSFHGEHEEPVAEPREREKPDRKERIPFGALKKRLPSVPDNDGFQYRVINDEWSKDPDRVKRAMQGGYEKVEGFDQMVVGTNEDGSAIKGTLMRIPQEWYDEDQKVKQREVDMVDEEIGRGKLDEKPDDKRYVPDGIKMWSGQEEPK